MGNQIPVSLKDGPKIQDYLEDICYALLAYVHPAIG